jgi:hypothetical protein
MPAAAEVVALQLQSFLMTDSSKSVRLFARSAVLTDKDGNATNQVLLHQTYYDFNAFDSAMYKLQQKSRQKSQKSQKLQRTNCLYRGAKHDEVSFFVMSNLEDNVEARYVGEIQEEAMVKVTVHNNKLKTHYSKISYVNAKNANMKQK